MNSTIDLIKTTRKNTLNFIENLTLEQLNTIPRGFNNSIGWNFAHCLITQQLLCYKLAGLPMFFDEETTDLYKKGSDGKAKLNEEILAFFKQNSMKFIDELEADYSANKFNKFNKYSTSYNFELTNIEEAIALVSAHEALHFGYIMAMKKVI
jgi:hypothetical protein